MHMLASPLPIITDFLEVENLEQMMWSCSSCMFKTFLYCKYLILNLKRQNPQETKMFRLALSMHQETFITVTGHKAGYRSFNKHTNES